MKKIIRTLGIAVVIVGVWYYSGTATQKKTDSETMVSETVEYSRCDHKEQLDYPISEKATGLSGEKASKVLKREYKGFEDNVLSVKSTSDGYCEKHFRTYLDGNSIKTESLKSGELVSEYKTAPSQYSKNDLKRLSAGIITDSPEALSALLEDYTS